MSLPAPKAQQKDSIAGAMRLLSLPRQSLHFSFLLPRISLQNSWRYSWRWHRPRLRHQQSLESVYPRLAPRKPIPENLTWIATTFVSNVKIILRRHVPQGWIVPFLLSPFSMVLLASDRLNTSDAMNASLSSRDQSLRPSSERISEALRPSLTISGVSLGGTPNTNLKKPVTRHPTFNTSNLSYQSLILSRPPTN